ncbi:hypothetical protein BC629DRAFT_1662786 [Irpex lacteus]|nr:hypothetical protein BC629DRAFT_1662786 [Irpex lacteus]
MHYTLYHGSRATGSKVSKREQKRRSEEATWQGPTAIKANPAKGANEQARGVGVSGGQQAQKAVPSPSESAQPAHPSQRNAPTTAWSASTAIAVTSHGNLALNQSSADVRKVFHRAEEEMKLSVVTQNAYEDIDARSKIRFLTNTLARAAWNSECPEIDNRLREDSGYARVLVEALSTRMSQFRGRFRTSAAARVAAYFGLNNGSGDLARRVEDLLAKKRYIYPVGLSENAARARPYENNILTEVVQDVLITRNRDFIKDNVDMFKVNWQGDKLLELPVPVIALSATAVHAALLNYRASKGSQSTEFSADQYSAIYDTHVTVLRTIQEQRPGAYHRLLKKLFEDVVGSSTSVTTRADANEVLEDLDFDNLDADRLDA